MIVLDTNVVSEMMKPSPSATVVDWLNRQEAVELYLTSVTIGEVSYGLRLLPRGERRSRVEQAFENVLSRAFLGRILDFDERAAEHYGDLMARRREMGRPLAILDGQIAAIARAHGAAVATRNVRDFVGCDVIVIDPFADA